MGPKRGFTLEPESTTVLLRVSRTMLVVVGSARSDDRPGTTTFVELRESLTLGAGIVKLSLDISKAIEVGFEELDDRAVNVVGHG